MQDRPVVLYDANVLYPAQLRDFLMRLALGKVARAHWTESIHEEWTENVHADYLDTHGSRMNATRRSEPCAELDSVLTQSLSSQMGGPCIRRIYGLQIKFGATKEVFSWQESRIRAVLSRKDR